MMHVCVCDTKVGYTVSVHVCWEDIQLVYGQGGCMYSECMYVLGVGVWAELCFSLPNPFFNAIQRL